jgi:hypothetical protein
MIKIIIHDEEDWALLCTILEDMERNLIRELQRSKAGK